jgi:MarR family 2-MHQ and catechol resistance regulon transcriptional repressor
MKPPLEVRTYGAMVAFVQHVQRAADAALAHSSVTPAQFFILATLKRRDGAQQSELAEALGVTAGNVSQLIAKLEDARLVKRVEQGKAKIATLTAKGEALVARLAPEHDAFLVARFASLDVSERRALLALLERLLEKD